MPQDLVDLLLKYAIVAETSQVLRKIIVKCMCRNILYLNRFKEFLLNGNGNSGKALSEIRELTNHN